MIGALATGSWAIALRHERAVPLFLATAIGAIVTLFIIGETVTPH